jgi:hypothetical protein
MRTIVVGVAAVVLGLVTFFVTIMIGEMVAHMMYPIPSDVDLKNPEAVRAMVAKLPLGALVCVLLAWAAGSFAGSWVAASVAPTKKIAFGLLIGSFGLLGAILNMLMIPHPIWMWILGVAEFLPMSYLGTVLAIRVRNMAVKGR